MTEPTACSLTEALAYDNVQVPYRFVARYDIPFADACELFDDTKRWLWLASHRDRPWLSVTPHIVAIDEMWHNFLCFTAEYELYCRRFGRFIHHFPTTKAAKDLTRARRAADPDGETERIREAAARQLAFIADKLGPETVRRWYVDFPIRFAGLVRLHERPFSVEGFDAR